jgi:hypothetical protein
MLTPELARRTIPTLTMLSMSPQTLTGRVRRLRRRLPEAVQARIDRGWLMATQP